MAVVATAGWAAALAYPAASLLALANGANDICNSVGTAVGAGALTMRQALVLGCIAEAIGAVTIGPFVAQSIASGQIHVAAFAGSPRTFVLLMLSSLLGAGISTLLATLYGAPISATHGIVSGIVTVALLSGTHGALDLGGIGFTLLGWAASPLAGLAAGFAVSLLVHRLVLGTRSPAAAAAKRQPLLLALIASLSFLFLLLKGPVFLRRRVAGRPLLALGAALAGGAAVAAGRSTVQWAEKRLRRWAARRVRRGRLYLPGSLRRAACTRSGMEDGSGDDSGSRVGGRAAALGAGTGTPASGRVARLAQLETVQKRIEMAEAEAEGRCRAERRGGAEEGSGAAGGTAGAAGQHPPVGLPVLPLRGESRRGLLGGGCGGQGVRSDCGEAAESTGGPALAPLPHDAARRDAAGGEAEGGAGGAAGAGGAVALAVACDSRTSPLEAEPEAGHAAGGGASGRASPTRAALAEGGAGRAAAGLRVATDGLLPSSSPEQSSPEGGAQAARPRAELDEVQRRFVPLLVLAGLTVALAHGANDVGNAVGPLAAILATPAEGPVALAPAVPPTAMLCGAGAFVVGILTLGERTISTVGSKITTLTPHRSFATQTGAAVAVLSSSACGLPVSTSHCLVGAVVGVSLAEKLCGVPNTGLDLTVLSKIVVGWVVTIPLAAAVAAAAFVLLSWLTCPHRPYNEGGEILHNATAG